MDSTSRHQPHFLPRTYPGRKRFYSSSQNKSAVPPSTSISLPLAAESASPSLAQPLTAYAGPASVAEPPTIYAQCLKLASLQDTPDTFPSSACTRRARALSLGRTAFTKPSLAEVSLESRRAICTRFPEVLRLLGDTLRNIEWTYTQPPQRYAYRLSPDRYTALQAQMRALQPQAIQQRRSTVRAPPIPSWGTKCAASAFHSANDFELLAVCFKIEVESFLADIDRPRERESAASCNDIAETPRTPAKLLAARERPTDRKSSPGQHVTTHRSSASIGLASSRPVVVNSADNTAPASRAPPRRSWYVIPCRSPEASSSSSEDSPDQAPALRLARAHTAETSSALPANPTATRERYTHGAIPPGQRINIVKATQNQSSSVLSAVPKSVNVDSASSSPPTSRARPRRSWYVIPGRSPDASSSSSSDSSPASPITSGAVALHSSSSQQYTHQPQATSNSQRSESSDPSDSSIISNTEQKPTYSDISDSEHYQAYCSDISDGAHYRAYCSDSDAGNSSRCDSESDAY